MYWQAPDPEKIAALGLRREDFTPPEVELWPDTWPAVQLFSKFATQWRVGMNGPVGLDYNVIQHDLARRALPDDEYDELMDAIRVIESAALDALREGND